MDVRQQDASPGHGALPLHDHVFGQDRLRPAERRTQIVILLTAVMMAVEIAAGIGFGSMALLADGLHMGSHATALAISAFAYLYARRHAYDRRYTFGTGKVNALGGFAGAVLLAIFALFMAYESALRLARPVPISFNQAILVAVLGLAVNGLSVLILGHEDHDDHHHEHDHPDDHDHHADDHEHHHDHNLRAAYLHVLADALTSVTAIVALLAGKYFHWVWMDPLMGVVGSLVVARWSWGLLRSTSAVLLDRQAPEGLVSAVVARLEAGSQASVTDIHIWSIGPSLYAAEIALAADQPRSPQDYKALLPEQPHLSHVTVEIYPRGHSAPPDAPRP